ncbi:PIG-L deacetylase family protein [Falsiroseomonas sp. CW058]|uniref:PIG-L deacetylase family protein n=1 Tax=Falsiroseomonas sp. CW058 TaxID=3388664 RepID=UPI003D30F527
MWGRDSHADRGTGQRGRRVMEAGPALALFAGGGVVEAPVLVLAAHPDDEVIGLGGQLPRLRRLHLLHVTDGAPRDGGDAAAHGFATVADYAAARGRELSAALALAGQDPGCAAGLGIADQQAALQLPRLVDAVAAALRALRPAILVTHPHEGGHPDHDATALAAQEACRRLAREGLPVPARLEMTSYHAAPGGIAVGRFLPAPGCPPVALRLDDHARDLKARMLGCFATQRRTLAQFPVTPEELLRAAPAYDFTRPPHPGPLFYETFPWGMTGERFRALAAAALAMREDAA